MAKHKLELFLSGEFTGIDICLEGTQIVPREINDNEYYKLYTEFVIENPLDIHVRLDGFFSMKWALSIKVDDAEVYTKKGEFDKKGFVTFTETVII
jgi:hypothetical protein